MIQKNKTGRSIDVVISIDGLPLGGQQGAIFRRQANMINITNKITGEWSESLAGVKSWNITCSGLYVVDDTAFNKLEEAFMNNEKITVNFSIGNNNFNGTALITDFPLNAVFNKEFKYNLSLLGTGALNKE